MEKQLVEYFQKHPMRVIGVLLGLVVFTTIIGRGTEVYVFPMLARWGL